MNRRERRRRGRKCRLAGSSLVGGDAKALPPVLSERVPERRGEAQAARLLSLIDALTTERTAE